MNHGTTSRRRARELLGVATAALAILIAGCGREQLADGLPNDVECNSCHGSAQNDAPPEPVGDAGTTEDVEIGAHQSHLADGEVSAAIPCEECHVVPETAADEGHIDPWPAEVVFGSLATTEESHPVWLRAVARCLNTYCHGSTLSGGQFTDPQWTLVDESQSACDACHGEPPPAPHPQRDECELCHSDTVLADGSIDIAGGAHLNGEIDFYTEECNLCHGSDDNDAPPVDTLGNDAETEVTVGAHQSHLGASDWHREVLCEDCHLVPEEYDDDGHMDDPPAELTWAAIAEADDAAPAFDREAAICSGVYCHGTTLLPGGSLTEPTWTVVDGTQSECGTCHGLPPGDTHPTSIMCDRCHGEVIDDTQSFVAPELHINGTVEVAEMDCNSCHGNDVNDAPPVDTFGNSDDSLVSVGAHQSHLGPSNWHREVACDDCHVVPAAVDDPGHLDDAPAEVTWGAVALADGAAPGPFDALAATCTGIYCHGSTLYPGGSNTDPVWTDVGTGQADCLTCHSNPPGDQHPAVALCEVCHGMVYDGEDFVDPALHVNGAVDVTGQGCTSCHGNSDNAAPPVDTLGESDTGFVTVGAHQSHLTDGDLRLAIECTECHYVPMLVDDPAHIDGFPADLTWGPLATADSSVPDWDRTAEQCTNVYCHGATIGGGSNKEPIWTIVDGTQAGCGTCHGFPPPPSHPADFDCAACHPGTVIGGVEIDVAGGLHIDGIVQ